MKTKTILITGATDGIGMVAAKELAKQGHKVIVHGRNENKAKKVVDEIKASTGNNEVDYILADLFSFESIKQMSINFKQRYDHLDVLINNAGAVLDNERSITKDGIEKTMALNVLAPLLLTQLLLDILKKSKDARVINMSSASHRASGKPNMADLNLEENYSAQKRYGLSKLYVIWNTRHMSRLLKDQGVNNVTVNVSHPGAVATNFGQDSDKGIITNLIYKIALPIMASPEKGASTNVFLATSPTVTGITGKYFGNSKEIKPYDRFYSVENEKTVWDYCMNVINPYLLYKY
ncbi:SDR family NAD(P)-dependent oxidoreductase [Niallia circulans]|uniref:SDR family NAD(P)-dependent oxidoreductase n=1 Tax=Niallia circulans TaxID=1397 RepID=A0A553STI3_NIACI|nr:SDR family NAD(P)-dependent oxidoreductase [Niallia circulans]TRZ40271.1 SDR family NAD(P)-dependent oxidoreductase [Niallia circulans]